MKGVRIFAVKKVKAMYLNLSLGIEFEGEENLRQVLEAGGIFWIDGQGPLKMFLGFLETLLFVQFRSSIFEPPRVPEITMSPLCLTCRNAHVNG